MRRGHVNGGSQHESLGFGSTSRQIRIKQGALNFVCTQYNYKSKKCSRKIQLRLPICWHNLAIFERPVCPRQCRRRPTPTATPTAPHFRPYITYSRPRTFLWGTRFKPASSRPATCSANRKPSHLFTATDMRHTCSLHIIDKATAKGVWNLWLLNSEMDY